MRRGSALAFVLVLVVSNLMMAESATAQSIPKPSVPEFTVKYMDNFYVIPARTSVDPFTGKSVTTPAQHVENKTVEIVIKNQFFSDLYYNVRYRGHFGQDWWFPFGSEDNEKCPKKYSNSEYTTIVFTPSESKSLFGNEIYAPSGSQVDFQVKAFVGGMEPIEPTPGIPPIGGSNIFKVQSESEWSNIQTLNMSETSISTSPSPNPTPTPTVPEFPLLAILSLFSAITLTSILMLRKRRKL